MASYINLTITLIFLLLLVSCENLYSDEPQSSELLEQIEEVSKIPGADDVTVVINKDPSTFFNIEFRGINSNKVIENGFREGWCIDWQKPIDSNNGVYGGITLYSTYLVERWKPVNYLLNIKEELLQEDPELTFREIQVVIWSLRAFPEFNLDDVSTEDLPSRMLVDGKPHFSEEKIEQIRGIVESGYREFDFSEGTKFAIVVATPAEVQTLITVSE